MSGKSSFSKSMGENRRRVEEKIFSGATIATALASILYLVLSLVLNYWLFTILISTTSAVVYGAFFVLNRFFGWFERLVIPFMVYTGALVIALWIGVGGFYSDLPLFLIGSLLLFVMLAPNEGYQRFAVASVASIYLLLVILQYTMPDIILNTGTKPDVTRFNVVSTGVIGITVGIVARTFRRSHDRDREKLRITMAELNHRVKNNLNLVSSLIRLKDNELGQRVDLSDLEHRVGAIAAMYRRFQDQGTVSEVNLSPYLEEILSGVFSFSREKRVVIENLMHDMTVSSRQAVTLGLIVNEIATNALKYGFGGTDVGEFRISLYEDGNDIWVLTTEENGFPIPEQVDLANSTTLGLQLIHNLSEQLDGKIEMIREPHPKFILTFPIDPR